MYYCYRMRLADHGVRTKQYRLIYYYPSGGRLSGAIDKDATSEWELFDVIKIRMRCTMCTTIRSWRGL